MMPLVTEKKLLTDAEMEKYNHKDPKAYPEWMGPSHQDLLWVGPRCQDLSWVGPSRQDLS